MELYFSGNWQMRHSLKCDLDFICVPVDLVTLGEKLMRRSTNKHWFQSPRCGPVQRRGAAAVETAFVLPIFLLFVFAIMEFGQAYLGQHLLSNAARLGARRAMLDTSTNAAVEQVVKDFCVESLGITADQVNVVIELETAAGSPVTGNSLANAGAGDRCTITVGVSYDEISLFPASYLNGRQLTRSYTLEHE